MQFHLVFWTAFSPEGFLWSPKAAVSHSSTTCDKFLITRALKGRAVPLLLLQDGLGRCCKAKRPAHGIFTTLREVKLSSDEHLPGGQRKNHPGGQPRSQVSPLRAVLMRTLHNLCLPALLAPQTAPKIEPEMQNPAEAAPLQY